MYAGVLDPSSMQKVCWCPGPFLYAKGMLVSWTLPLCKRYAGVLDPSSMQKVCWCPGPFLYAKGMLVSWTLPLCKRYAGVLDPSSMQKGGNTILLLRVLNTSSVQNVQMMSSRVTLCSSKPDMIIFTDVYNVYSTAYL